MVDAQGPVVDNHIGCFVVPVVAVDAFANMTGLVVRSVIVVGRGGQDTLAVIHDALVVTDAPIIQQGHLHTRHGQIGYVRLVHETAYLDEVVATSTFLVGFVAIRVVEWTVVLGGAEWLVKCVHGAAPMENGHRVGTDQQEGRRMICMMVDHCDMDGRLE